PRSLLRGGPEHARVLAGARRPGALRGGAKGCQIRAHRRGELPVGGGALQRGVSVEQLAFARPVDDADQVRALEAAAHRDAAYDRLRGPSLGGVLLEGAGLALQPGADLQRDALLRPRVGVLGADGGDTRAGDEARARMIGVLRAHRRVVRGKGTLDRGAGDEEGRQDGVSHLQIFAFRVTTRARLPSSSLYSALPPQRSCAKPRTRRDCASGG